MTMDEFVGSIENGGLSSPGMAAVAAFEMQTALTLPEDYRAFLAATPGGRVGGNVRFSLAGKKDGPEIMGNVYGLHTEGSISLVKRLADAEEDAVPQGLLPIMRVRGGDTIGLMLRPARLGEIVFLEHEVADEGRATLEAAEADDWGAAGHIDRHRQIERVPFERQRDRCTGGC